jgi:hypothetical protein
VKPQVLRIKLLICAVCVQENVPSEERFRASDSVRGRRSIDEHILDDHSAAVVNALLEKGQE